MLKKFSNIGGCLALFCGFAMYVTAFEPFGIAEFSYIFAVPIFLAARFGGLSSKAWRNATLIGAWFSWVAILVWLRFVYPPSGVFFLTSLSLVMAAFFFIWLFAVRKIALLPEDSLGLRLCRIVFLTSLWVFLEWVRSFIFTGFPWMLLAHSQWRRPAMIQAAEYGGPYIVSFVLIFFNLALAEFVSRLWRTHKWRLKNFGVNKASPKPPAPAVELYVALAMVLGSFYLYVSNFSEMSKPREGFRVGMVQTDYAGIMRWNPDLGLESMETLKNLTLGLKKARVDVVLWPEASTPPMWPVIGTAGMKEWVEKVSSKLGVPILMGNGAYLKDENGERIYNAAFAVSPESGLSKSFYAKQKLVPFGEYLPGWCFFLKNTVVPVGRMEKGSGPSLLDAEIAGKNYKIGSIICYEDIFPQIGRASAKAGADVLFVCTNDSWYGREGGAWQHAAHSAFQAVSTRRPVLRASINGLSGVFDQFGVLVPVFTLRAKNGGVYDGTGAVADVLDVKDTEGKPISQDTLKRKLGGPMANDDGSIYFRGAGYADLRLFDKFDSYETFYMRHGDWLPKLCGVFLVICIFWRKKCLTHGAEK